MAQGFDGTVFVEDEYKSKKQGYLTAVRDGRNHRYELIGIEDGDLSVTIVGKVGSDWQVRSDTQIYKSTGPIEWTPIDQFRGDRAKRLRNVLEFMEKWIN